MSDDFLAVFVPLFVALTPLSAISMFMSLTEGQSPAMARALANKALFTAFAVALAVILVGHWLFRLLGITLDDLRVGGGAILLAISINDLMFAHEDRKKLDFQIDPDLGAVPIGTPLIVGPATMTACVVLADTYGKGLVVFALLLNLLLIAVFLLNADRMRRRIRPAIARAFSKVMSLFLAAIAVSMLRVGIGGFVRSFH